MASDKKMLINFTKSSSEDESDEFDYETTPVDPYPMFEDVVDSNQPPEVIPSVEELLNKASNSSGSDEQKTAVTEALTLRRSSRPRKNKLMSDDFVLTGSSRVSKPFMINDDSISDKTGKEKSKIVDSTTNSPIKPVKTKGAKVQSTETSKPSSSSDSPEVNERSKNTRKSKKPSPSPGYSSEEAPVVTSNGKKRKIEEITSPKKPKSSKTKKDKSTIDHSSSDSESPEKSKPFLKLLAQVNIDIPEKPKSCWYPHSIVWAKLEGYPWWPSVIVDPATFKFKGHTPKQIPQSYPVYFLGEENWNWVKEKNLLPFRDERFDDFRKSILRQKCNNPKVFKEAMSIAEAKWKDQMKSFKQMKNACWVCEKKVTSNRQYACTLCPAQFCTVCAHPMNDEVDSSSWYCGPCYALVWRHMKNLLDKLKSQDKKKLFWKPVDKASVESYYDIIKTPMDYTTMSTKLNSFVYSTLDDLEDDFRLICNNAMEFNEERTEYFVQAKIQLEAGLKLSEQCKAKIDSLHISSSVTPHLQFSSQTASNNQKKKKKKNNASKPPKQKRKKENSSPPPSPVVESSNNVPEKIQKKSTSHFVSPIKTRQNSKINLDVENDLNILSECTIGDNSTTIDSLRNQIESLSSDLTQKNERIAMLEKMLTKRNDEITTLKKIIESKQNEVESLRQTQNENETEIQQCQIQHQKELTFLRESLDIRDKELATHRNKALTEQLEMDKAISQRTEEAAFLRKQLEQKDQTIAELQLLLSGTSQDSTSTTTATATIDNQKQNSPKK